MIGRQSILFVSTYKTKHLLHKREVEVRLSLCSLPLNVSLSLSWMQSEPPSAIFSLRPPSVWASLVAVDPFLPPPPNGNLLKKTKTSFVLCTP